MKFHALISVFYFLLKLRGFHFFFFFYQPVDTNLAQTIKTSGIMFQLFVKDNDQSPLREITLSNTSYNNLD